VVFHVTGFGPFQGVDNNPTTQIVTELSAYLKNFPLDPEVTNHVEVASYNVFETSAVGALTQFTEILQQHQISRERDNGTVIVFLHLGVNARGECFLLEKNGCK